MKNKFLAFILFFMTYSIFTQETTPSFLRDLKFKPLEFSPPKVEEKSLGEKLKVYSIKDNETPIQSIEIQFFVNELESYPEKPNELLRVLGDTWLFSEDLNKSSFLSQFEFYGANLSVHTTQSMVLINISYLQKFEKQILDLLSQFLKNPIFTDVGIEKSKKKVIEHIKRRNDSIFSISSRKMKEVIFKDTKRGNSIQIEKIEKIEKTEVINYYQEILKQTRKTVLFVGDFKESLYAELENLLLFNNTDKLIKKSKITRKLLSDNLSKNSFDTLIVDSENSQSVISMVGILPKRSHEDYYAIRVVNHILGGSSFSSYFGKRIRSDAGLSYVAYTNIHLKNNYGFVSGLSQTKVESTKKAYTLMKEILSDKTFNEIKQEELNLAKDTLINHFVFYFSSNFAFLSYYASLEEDNMPKDFLENYQENIAKISLEDVKRVAKKYFRFEKMKTIIVGKAKEIEGDIYKNIETIKPEDLIP